MTQIKQIVLATANAGKVKELAHLLQDHHIEIIAQDRLRIPSIEETGTTFVENALLKARHAAKLSGLPAIADDSGLCVDYLNGQPGIYSARYAGEHASATEHIQKLLHALQNVPPAQRSANFYCTLVYLRNDQDPMPIICSATWRGKILTTPHGTAGFGYDPVFYLPRLKKTAAQLPPEIKNKLSHRGKALRNLMKKLRTQLAEN